MITMRQTLSVPSASQSSRHCTGRPLLARALIEYSKPINSSAYERIK
jgi:hypothetical protein